MWPFERGRTYNRRRDIHARYGGQQQGGIITPARFPLVIAITGDAGTQHGYADELRDDGVFEYFGEGQVGDMKLAGGNKAIEAHSQDGKSLLLFRKERDARLRYEGEWVCQGLQERRAPDREGTNRLAFVFELRPLEAVEVVVDETSPEGDDIAMLRAKAYAAASPVAATRNSVGSVFDRSRSIRDYVLARSKGSCEGCNNPAPFRRISDGLHYLETHHTRRLSDGGPDDPRFVIALCPNCHRRIHAGQDGAEYNRKLIECLSTIEASAGNVHGM